MLVKNRNFVFYIVTISLFPTRFPIPFKRG